MSTAVSADGNARSGYDHDTSAEAMLALDPATRLRQTRFVSRTRPPPAHARVFLADASAPSSSSTSPSPAHPRGPFVPPHTQASSSAAEAEAMLALDPVVRLKTTVFVSKTRSPPAHALRLDAPSKVASSHTDDTRLASTTGSARQRSKSPSKKTSAVHFLEPSRLDVEVEGTAEPEAPRRTAPAGRKDDSTSPKKAQRSWTKDWRCLECQVLFSRRDSLMRHCRIKDHHPDL